MTLEIGDREKMREQSAAVLSAASAEVRHRQSLDRAETVATFTTAGLTGPEIADRMGLSLRSVYRLRAVSRAFGCEN